MEPPCARRIWETPLPCRSAAIRQRDCRELLFLFTQLGRGTRDWLPRFCRLGHSNRQHGGEGGVASALAQMPWADSHLACRFANEWRALASGWRLYSLGSDVAELSVHNTDRTRRSGPIRMGDSGINVW